MEHKAFYDTGQPFSGTDTINLIKNIVGDDPILLSFSCGKDSIALWLTLKEHFNIIPFYLYLVPDLDFVESSLAYYEKFFNTHIVRVPHPSLYRMLNNLVFQPPERVAYIISCDLPNFTYDDVSKMVGDKYGLKDPFTASGVRAADSPNRRSSIMKHSPVTWKRKYFYPIWDMKIDQVVSLLGKNKVKLPIDYRVFGRSFDGIDHRFLSVIKKNFPADYSKILDWFPLADLEIMRYANH